MPLLDAFAETSLLKNNLPLCFTVHTASANKLLHSWKQNGSLPVRAFVVLSDDTGRLCHVRFEAIRKGMARTLDVRVWQFDAYFHDVAKSMMQPKSQRANKFGRVYDYIHAVFGEHKDSLGSIGYTLYHDKDEGFRAREGLTFEFPKVESLRIDNRMAVTRVAAALVAGAPCLRRLAVRGAIQMCVGDRTMNDDADNMQFGVGYSFVQPPRFISILDGLSPDIEFLDLDDCFVGGWSSFDVFCVEFIAALTTDRFPELKELSMRGTYEAMPKAEGVPLMAALALSLSLRRVCLGVPDKFKKWQHVSAHDLRDARPDLLVLCV